MRDDDGANTFLNAAFVNDPLETAGYFNEFSMLGRFDCKFPHKKLILFF
jgi:hypothetical protein